MEKDIKKIRMKCPVCKKNSYMLEKGFCELVGNRWMTISRDKGYCSKCKFRYIEKPNDSFKKKVKEYKRKFIERLTKKIKKSK